ncbi:MAG: glutamate--tRNA ligase [Planctomycetota bacterium]
MTVRVRFAPSPTGYLHIGGARTALFNWLFARQHGGTFILRIEDTDKERSTPENVQVILDALRWLGLDWDEGPEVGGPHGPYFQSERTDIYAPHAQKLLAEGKAYRCFATPEELETMREEQKARGEQPHYDGRGLKHTPEEVEKMLAEGKPYVVRFRVPEGSTVIDDQIKGRVEVQNSEVDDFILLRSDGSPTYNFVVCIDDTDMGITHVIRGDDHFTNAMKQALMIEALGFERPVYAHIPLIFGPDKKKLSKRHGAVSVLEYRDKGYLPEAFINFLALLGWSFDDKQTLFDVPELTAKFTLEKVSKSPSIFDLDKLDWFGGEYVRQKPAPELTELAIPVLVEAGLLKAEEAQGRRAWLEKLVAAMQPRFRRLPELPEMVTYFFQGTAELDYEEKAVQKLEEEGAADRLTVYRESLESSSFESTETLEAEARALCEAKDIKFGKLVHPVRAALSGRTQGPGLFDIVYLLGKDECLARIDRALKLIEQGSGFPIQAG